MITRAEADPDLHVLRSARSALSLVEGRERSALDEKGDITPAGRAVLDLP